MKLNMTEQEKLNLCKGVVYHEIGHLVGYLLSNENEQTKLGELSEIEFKEGASRVVPKNRLYHFENINKEKDAIIQNAANIERTLAWFIEVLMGCVFQSLFEGKDFTECFGYEDGKSGRLDFMNLTAIKPFTDFNHWGFADIVKLKGATVNAVKIRQVSR